ncbi:MAG: response regulator transcription factor [Janthinobacterium lividum]
MTQSKSSTRFHLDSQTQPASETHPGPQGTQTSIHLTKTETRVLHLIAEGMDAGEIADLMSLSKRTAEFHISNLAQKFGTPNRVRWLVSYGEWRPTGGAESQAVHKRLAESKQCVCCAAPCLLAPVVGVLFTVPMCEECLTQLHNIRAEAEERIRQETA